MGNELKNGEDVILTRMSGVVERMPVEVKNRFDGIAGGRGGGRGGRGGGDGGVRGPGGRSAMKDAIRWFSRNHVAGNFLMLAVLLAGFTTWFKLKKEIFPETSDGRADGEMPYPNATPGGGRARGGACRSRRRSRTSRGSRRSGRPRRRAWGACSVEVETGYDVRNVMDDVKTRVDAIHELCRRRPRRRCWRRS